jgi:hypothetical protein
MCCPLIIGTEEASRALWRHFVPNISSYDLPLLSRTMNPYTSDGVLIVMVGAYFAESAQPHRQLFALTDPGLEARILSTKNGQSDSEGGGNVDTRANVQEAIYLR